MSRRLWIALAVAVAVLAFGATTAVAHTTKTDTGIDVDGIENAFGDHWTLDGDLDSQRDRCERFRPVLAFAVSENNGGSVTYVDTDVTNAAGAWVLQGPVPSGTDQVVLHTPEEDTGTDGHSHICRSETETLAWPPL